MTKDKQPDFLDLLEMEIASSAPKIYRSVQIN